MDHGRNGTDDYANALAGLLYLLSKKSKYNYDTSLAWVGGDSDTDINAEWRAEGLRHHILFGGMRRLCR